MTALATPTRAPDSIENESRRFASVAAFALVTILIALLTDAFHHVSKGEVGAFATYYKAATLLRAGQSPYGAMRGYPYVYPPFWAWLCQPLATLPRDVAARIMVGINAALLVGALLLSARSTVKKFLGSAPLVRVLPVTLISMLLIAVQLHKELRSLQTDVVLMIGFVLAIFWLDRRPRLAGMALAFAITVKYVPLISVPYLLLRRRWAAVGGVAIGLLLWTLLPASTLGINTNFRYLKQSVSGLSHLASSTHNLEAAHAHAAPDEARVHGLSDKMDHSITSALTRFASVMHWPISVGLAMDAALAIGWIAWMLTLTSGTFRSALLWPPATMQGAMPYRQRVALEWAVLMTAAMVFSPAALLILSVYPATLFSALLLCAPAARRSIAIRVGMALLWLALLLPFAALGSAFEVRWNAAGVSCWMLLASTTLLIYGARSVLDERAATLASVRPLSFDAAPSAG